MSKSILGGTVPIRIVRTMVPHVPLPPLVREPREGRELWVIDYVARHAHRLERGFPEMHIPPTTDPAREERLRAIPPYLAEIDDE